MTHSDPSSGAPSRVVIHPDKQAVADAGAARLLTAIIDAQAERAEAQLALTGGSMGSTIITSLLNQPGREAVDWHRVRIWWGDERYLPAGHPDRNDTQNDDAGLTALGLDPAKVHRVAGPDSSGSVQDSADAYAADLRRYGLGAFDVVMLGVGPDAHVASLFPHHPAQRITGAIAVPVEDSPKPPPTRVSLTFEALNRTRAVWFLVAGAEKADALAAALAPGATAWDVPAAGVHGTDDSVWLVDQAAAALLRH
ncbi:6-phosphogluconolactonase [Branchiibius hedensis]|uniref:6-phosphogluconolactonase n=1 Tax=Branchiibius hedensis TaxID=672460 RepID=A0A2Y8ZQ40_9MICO|nr:6-phosphogluconolactonase [Branchiibius hedensis]PWJ25231.1 6-phosphogluconolactonase [Branchiibius hedensis]SSA34045.1 6-phosphogluconolactonase [Branchiibius hedensis]